MIGAFLLFLQVSTAQVVPPVPSKVTVQTGKTPVTVPVVMTDDVPTVSATKLAAALGGSVRAGDEGRYTMIVGEARVIFTTGTPFARIDTTVIPLTSSPTAVQGALYVPFDVVSQVIPHWVTGFLYDADDGELRKFDTSARKVAATPPPPTPSSSSSSDDASAGDPPATDASAPHGTVLPPTTSAHPHLRHHHIVIVDAGHGGVDNGMTGPIAGGPKIYEKYITLSVARLLARDLRDDGIEVVMTRTTDTLIALADRGQIANRSHGDVFVSVHVNATGSRGRDAIHERGYETYFLAEAKTEDARRVEKMENEAVRFETGANAPKGDPLSYILNDMAQNEHLRESNELAQLVQDGFHHFHPGPDRGVQQANFAVLRGSYMPAVLVEIGFGTNPREAAFISDPDNERTIAHSIAQSVVTYLERYEARVEGGR